MAESAAFLICDMWDVHWCKSATQRSAGLAERIEALLPRLRDAGTFVIHAPSDAFASYADWSQRDRMAKLPVTPPPPEMRLDEPPLPARNPGCPDDPWCTPVQDAPWPWTRQHPAITIASGDGISDDGSEVYSALSALSLDRLYIAGVHTDMCILDRPFGIRQMRRWEVDCALVGDLTEAWMPSDTPAVLDHVANHLCPVVDSTTLG